MRAVRPPRRSNSPHSFFLLLTLPTKAARSLRGTAQNAYDLGKGYLGAFGQFLVGNATKGMQNFGVRETDHAKGLGGHTGGRGKLLGADYGCGFATLFNH